MQAEHYRGYTVRGVGWPKANGQCEASGGIEHGNRLIYHSEEIGEFPSLRAAAQGGLDWAKAWVDAHRGP